MVTVIMVISSPLVKRARGYRMLHLKSFQQSRDTMLFKCWASVCYAGPALKQHRVSVLFGQIRCIPLYDNNCIMCIGEIKIHI